jgi:hypothetical protein
VHKRLFPEATPARGALKNEGPHGVLGSSSQGNHWKASQSWTGEGEEEGRSKLTKEHGLLRCPSFQAHLVPWVLAVAVYLTHG